MRYFAPKTPQVSMSGSRIRYEIEELMNLRNNSRVLKVYMELKLNLADEKSPGVPKKSPFLTGKKKFDSYHKPQVTHNSKVKHQSSPRNFADENHVLNPYTNPLLCYQQLPPGAKIIKIEPGMKIPPGAIRVPASQVARKPLESANYKLAYEYPKLGSQSLEQRSKHKYSLNAKPFIPSSWKPTVTPLSIEEELKNFTGLQEGTNMSEISIENPLFNSTKDSDDSKTSTLGSSFDSFNIQIQLPPQ